MLTRREFLAAAASITASTAYGADAQQSSPRTKPNILFILADDLGWGDLSCYGRPDYKTPVPVYFYRAPDWKREVVTDTFTGLIHGIEPTPWEGMKGQALLSAGFMGIYLHRFANGKWTPAEKLLRTWPLAASATVMVL